MLFQEKKLVAEIKKTAKTGNEVRFYLFECYGASGAMEYMIVSSNLVVKYNQS